MRAWRDVDSERRKFGLTLWASGGEVRVGKRLYRWRYRQFGQPIPPASLSGVGDGKDER